MTLDVHIDLVAKIDAFLSESGMSASYFGKLATGNSEVVARLKAGRSITGRTEARISAFIAERTKAGDEKAA